MTTQTVDAAEKLTEAQRDFLERVADGRPLGLADRVADKVRQKMRRAGYVQVLYGPRRWAITPLGAHLLQQERSA